MYLLRSRKRKLLDTVKRCQEQSDKNFQKIMLAELPVKSGLRSYGGLPFDGIAHPDKFNVEDVIIHDVDLSHEKVLFSTDSKDKDIIMTVDMLDRMFNGTHASRGRVLMESRFYNIFKMKYNHFQSVVNDYLAGNKNDMRPVIEELVDIGSEFLAFKYHVIMQNAQLKNDFQHLLKWNKLG